MKFLHFNQLSQLGPNFTIFSCPSSSMPTLLTDSLTHWLTDCSDLKALQTIQNPRYQYKTNRFRQNVLYFSGIPGSWPDFRTVDKFQKSDQISEFQPNFTILSKFHIVGQISTILIKLHNLDKISQLWSNFLISIKFYNFNQILQFQPNFTD